MLALEHVDHVQIVRLSLFFEREACGQCPPCSVGTANIAGILRSLEAGEAGPRQLGHLADAAAFMAGHGYCAHTRTGSAAVTGVVGRFKDDVDAHLAAGRCPRPEGAADPFASNSPERAAIEKALVSVLEATAP